jgi:hypothetical protein
LQVEVLGIDFIQRRDEIFSAVTGEEAAAAAKRLLDA